MKKLMALLMACTFFLPFAACSKQETKTDVQAVASVKTESKKTVVEGDGIVKIKDVYNLVLDFPAIIQEVPFQVGDKVKKGNTLFVINYSEYEQQIKNQEIEIQILQNTISQLNVDLTAKSAEDISGCDPELKKLYNDLNDAQNIYEEALKDLEVNRKLFEASSITKNALDEFVMQVNAKKKATEDTKYALNTEIYNKRSELEESTQKIEELQNNLDTMKSKISKNYINGNNVLSEVDNGVVAELGYLPGDTTDPTNLTKTAVSIMNLDSRYIEADIQEDDLKDVKVGADATFTLKSDPNKVYKGKVEKFSGKALVKDGDTFLPIEIAIDKADELLIPDLNVQVEVSIK